MAYNKAKEEYRWNQWKAEEEKILREQGVDEETIQKLREYDWDDFNAETHRKAVFHRRLRSCQPPGERSRTVLICINHLLRRDGKRTDNPCLRPDRLPQAASGSLGSKLDAQPLPVGIHPAHKLDPARRIAGQML